MGNEISIDISGIKASSRNTWILRGFITFCAVLSLVMGISSGFKLGTGVTAVLPGALIGGFLFQFLLRKKKSAIIGYVAFLVAAAAAGIAMMNQVGNGFAKLANDVLTTVNKNMAMANLMFVVDESTAKTDELITVILLSFVSAAVMALIIRARLNLLASLLVFLAVTLPMIYKGDGSAVWLMLGLVSVVLIMYVGNVHGRITADMYVHLGICMAVIAGLTMAVYMFVAYSPLQVVDDIKTNMQYHGENVIYGKSDYPEGKFSRYDDTIITGEERLQIRMSQPKQMYMRGFVGSKYTEDGWEDSDLKIYGGDYEGVFEWFSSNDYSPLANLSAYVTQSAENGGEAADNSIYVEISNISARRKYQYVPECVTYSSLENLYAPKNDVNFRSQGLGRETDYFFDMVDVINNDYKAIYGEKWYQDQTGDKIFHDSENVYGTFARKYYEDIPDDMREYFDSHVPNAGQKMNPFDAIKVVRDYMAGQMSYKNDADEYTGDEDFVIGMLDGHKAGYSAHFATVATMLFRYYGIPARYVEGYLVNPVAGSDVISVTDEDSHAWVEIYAGGLGFIPIEVTPGYYSEDDDTGKGNTDSGTTPQTIPPEPEDQQEDNGGGGGSMETVLLIGYIILGLIALFIVVLIIRRIVCAIVRRKRMNDPDNEKSIAASGDYMAALMAYQKKKLEDNISPQLLDLLRRYKFSRYIPTADDAKFVRESALEMKKNVVHEENILSRIKLGFWNAIR